MLQLGRENTLENDLFFLCSVIEYIGRVTKNRRSDVVCKLGVSAIKRLLDLADVLHSEPLESTAQELIKKHSVKNGTFCNTSLCDFNVPSVFDIAKVYKRLIIAVANKRGQDIVNSVVEIYTLWISAKIDNYNSSMFFESPDYIFRSYILGEPINDSHELTTGFPI